MIFYVVLCTKFATSQFFHSEATKWILFSFSHKLTDDTQVQELQTNFELQRYNPCLSCKTWQSFLTVWFQSLWKFIVITFICVHFVIVSAVSVIYLVYLCYLNLEAVFIYIKILVNPFPPVYIVLCNFISLVWFFSGALLLYGFVLN